MKPKKKKIKKDTEAPVKFAALAKLTSSGIIHQVKMGMNKIAPLDSEGDVFDFEEPSL